MQQAAGGKKASAAPKLWLDRQLELSIDLSVPQIGGTAARLRGLTGAGVTVAVLDTGVDETHPDLAGKVCFAQGGCRRHRRWRAEPHPRLRAAVSGGGKRRGAALMPNILAALVQAWESPAK